jgi:predicted nucleotide-binding protein (sugar kinase/HSP70/actin superfamily)
MQRLDSADRSAEDVGSSVLEDIEREVRAFEAEERRRLGLEARAEHWRDVNPQRFTKEERTQTTILFGGLTEMHDTFLEAGLGSLGYGAKALARPDTASLQYGKEFGNRAQCNPTYFTVGNLIKHLARLRDAEGMSTEHIVGTHVFFTLGSCGPCRFGTYITEYRKAVRDAGFEGFRIFDIRKLSRQKPGDAGGVELDARFFAVFFKALLAADVINAMGYRTRPYETTAGATDRALEDCKAIVSRALAGGGSVLRALARCRKRFAAIEVDRLRPKPKVSIIGEFWAMTTEGDGNYRLQRFLEAEGAECEIPLIATWILYEIWCAKQNIRERMMLRRADTERHRSESETPLTTLFLLSLGRAATKLFFYTFAKAIGLEGWRLPDMDHLADNSHKWYPNELQGGEGPMEVAKVIDVVTKRKAHMVVSVKPFGCMPSSGVSDGIQSLVTARYPEANFCPVETSGDGSASVYSRVQMALFRARAKALEEFETALAASGLDAGEALRRAAARRRLRSPLHYPRPLVACTAANAVYELARSAPGHGVPNAAPGLAGR